MVIPCYGYPIAPVLNLSSGTVIGRVIKRAHICISHCRRPFYNTVSTSLSKIKLKCQDNGICRRVLIPVSPDSGKWREIKGMFLYLQPTDHRPFCGQVVLNHLKALGSQMVRPAIH